MEWFWLFIGISTVAVLSVMWFLGPREEMVHENPLRVKRSLLWMFVLFILAPMLGLAVGLLTNSTP
ncbi:MAG: hypothetical protein ACM3XO_22155 [Bacteroidota bacterium]|jgi:hypothetical protein